MIPVDFAQSNKLFGPPAGLDECQCRSVPAYVGTIERGSCEGAGVIVVAWSPTREELAQLMAGHPVFLSCLGGLPPHLLSTSFDAAVSPA